MKNFIYIVLFCFLSACCSTKKVIENTPSNNSKIIAKAEIPKTTDIPKQINEVVEIVKEEKTAIKHNTTSNAFNHITWNVLLQQYVSNSGNVNYVALKKNRKILLNYIDSLRERMPTKTWPKEDKLAYWINAYNAMTIDLILRHYPIKSIKDIKNPWKQRYWKLGKKWYNLEDIEHKILQKMNEPRIHFVIVCASISCPKLLNKAYSASNLEEQLTKATKDFLSDSARNNISQNSLSLSKIFQWFAKDFKQNGSLISFLNQYSDIKISTKAKKSFKKYNWDLNE